MEKVVCTHPRAKRDYDIEENYEAGIELKGSEVKSLRANQASIKESFAMIRDGEVFLINSYIAPYEQANLFNHEPRRDRKLLLNKREINRLMGKTLIRGYTLVPTKVYFKRGKAKVDIALGKGKKVHDRRDDIKKREADREMEKALKRRY
ncbi:MAG: SsrA-binding protein SmpB [Thermodesulfobacteriota bacterium]|jgi:SsrA-binding protein|nr:SsrA-binding protein SmpB [Candidatus Dadabacteria bacterium]